MTEGLLVMAYGTASGPDDVERYYTDIRGGRTPSPDLVEDLKRRYAAIGNDFPLDRITREQAAGLERALGITAYVGYKHSPPLIGEAVRDMAADGVTQAVGIVMAPHYSVMSIGGYVERAAKAGAEHGVDIDVIESWHLHPAYLDVLAQRVRRVREGLTEEERANDLVIFSAHSLPSRIEAEGDPYPRQLRETAEAVAERLGLERFATAWQSAGRTPEPWLGPPLDEVIEKAAAQGHTAVVSCPCGFTADHLEILYDVDIEAREAAERAGIRLVRTASMNDDPDFIRALADVVLHHLEGLEGDKVPSEEGTWQTR
jgi:protoporphyrin/coproporphyrin ferrochelatase